MFDSFLQAVAPVSALALVVELIALLLSILLLWWREFAPITRLQDPPKSRFGLIRIAKYQTTDDESLPQNSKTSTAGNGDSPIFTIIWVHGLGSNPDTTWLGNTLRGVQDSRPTLPPELRVNWIEDLLFPDLVALSKTAIEMFHYNYESYWLRDSVQQRLPRMAEDMLMHICHYLSQQIDVGTLSFISLSPETLTFSSQERNANSSLWPIALVAF
jgi:hypothetical protein